MLNRSIEMLTAQVTLDEEIRLDRSKMTDELLGGFAVGPTSIDVNVLVLGPGVIHFKAIGPMFCVAREKVGGSDTDALIRLLRESQID
jgi:hypothetical protein